MRSFGLALCMFWSISVAAAAAEDIQLLFPDNNVSSKPILEFRARAPSLEDGKEIGHAYVLLGRELDNGLTLYNAVKGFYPDTGGSAKNFTNIIYGPGKVTQTLPDAKSEITFKVYITPLQETKVVNIIKQWDDKKYSLPFQNCIDLTKAVATAVGLTLPSMPKDLLPWTFIKALSSNNDKDTPLRSTTTAGRGSNQPLPPGNGGPSALDAGRKTMEDVQRMTGAQQPPTAPGIVTPQPPTPAPIVSPPAPAPVPSAAPPPPPPTMPPPH